MKEEWRERRGEGGGEVTWWKEEETCLMIGRGERMEPKGKGGKGKAGRNEERIEKGKHRM